MQLQEERKTEIDKDNVMLFQKMNRILKRDDPYNQTVGPRPNSKRSHNGQDRIYEENKSTHGVIQSWWSGWRTSSPPSTTRSSARSGRSS